MNTGSEPAAPPVVALDSDVEGLTTAEATRRLAEVGPNRLAETEARSPWGLFVAQFRAWLVYLLVGAAVLSLAVGLLPGVEPNVVDAALILGIVIANGAFGFAQDYRAEQALAALRALSLPRARVVRDGRLTEVDAATLVPGDVVVIEAGDAVPADARVLSSAALAVDESALTGESLPVEKGPDPVPPGTPLAERTDMCYMGTAAVRGRARAVVVATGMDSEVGTIARDLQTIADERTPFAREVDVLGRRIGLGVLVLVALVALVQFTLTTAAPLTVVLTAITLAVAAVPEGLPAVVTLTLALGARRLLARDALIRRLPAVEGLGSVDVIVTDKTGTLTENRMRVGRLYAAGVADLRRDGAATLVARREGESPAAYTRLLRCGAVCNDARYDETTETLTGDPTETALVRAALDLGVETTAERLAERPFDADRKLMSVLVREASGPVCYTKGAPEAVLDRCTHVHDGDGGARALTDADRAAIDERSEAFAEDALRVLAFAYRPLASVDGIDLGPAGEAGVAPAGDAGHDTARTLPAEVESDLVFLGLQGLIDPPRAEVPDAVADCQRAGIRVVMMTGDNAVTARALATAVGIDGGTVLTGTDIDEQDEATLRETVEAVAVFARMAPAQKVRALRALQANGHRVAMTGDGVNDGPALRAADVGIAMGRRGTDVARGASDVVLRDDDFATIRDAIAAGRGIFDNVRKFVTYLLSANAGEVAVVFVGVVLASLLLPATAADGTEVLVLTPVMLLWINLVTDGLPALALGADPSGPGVLSRPPRPPSEGVIDRGVLVAIAVIAVTMTGCGLGLFFGALWLGEGLVLAQTMLFTFLVTAELGRVQLIRREYGLSLASNRWLGLALVGSFGLQLLVLYTPLAGAFGVVALGVREWAAVVAAALTFFALAAGLEAVVLRLLERSKRWLRAG